MLNVNILEQRECKKRLIISSIISLIPITLLIASQFYKDGQGIELIDIILTIFIATIALYNARNYLILIRENMSIGFKIIKPIVSIFYGIGIIISSLVLYIILWILLDLIIRIVVVGEDYIFYTMKKPYDYFIFLPMVFLGEFIYGMAFKKTLVRNREKEKNKKLKYIYLLLIPYLYIALTNGVVVTEDGIKNYSFYNPLGTEYSFEDVKYVEAGFSKWFQKGEFYYKVEMEDGTRINLTRTMGDENDKYREDSWKEYVDIDEKIMEYGAIKTSSEEGVEHNGMDNIYLDKLLKVIRNK